MDDLSKLLGWSYFLCWSCSFYPQFILNFRRHSTEGLSIDFQWLNFMGFACYSFFNVMMFWNERVREDDAIRNGGDLPDLVKVNDVFFALHALTLTTLTLAQIYWFGPIPKLSRSVKTALIITFLFLMLIWLEVLARNIKWDPDKDFLTHNLWTWLGFCLLASFVKLGVTLVKYIPQAYLNFKRKSTEGWAIANILLDFSGGVLSFAQLFVDAQHKGDWNLIIDNPVKLLLSSISIGFDILFILQHYYLYPASSFSSSSQSYARVGQEEGSDTERADDEH